MHKTRFSAPAIKAVLLGSFVICASIIAQQRIDLYPAGAFDLVLLDVAGRAIYRVNAKGPKSFVLQKGMVHNGTYVAHLISGGREINEKVVIAQ